VWDSYGVASAGTISHGGVSILEDVLGIFFKRCRWRVRKGIVVTIQEVTGETNARRLVT
jgi:hypothetical protein